MVLEQSKIKYKRKSGFTLIELLGVIILLSVISLVTIPIVLSTVDESRKSTLKNSFQSLLKAIDMDKDYNNPDLFRIYTITNGIISPDVSFDGELKGDGQILVNSEGNIKLRVQTEDWCVLKEYTQNKVDIRDGNCPLASADEYVEYAYLPSIQADLIRGTKTLAPQSELFYNSSTHEIIYTGSSKNIILPRKIGAKTLENFFFIVGNDGAGLLFDSIYLPDGIKVIDTYAFNRQSILTSITFPPSVEELGNWVFDGATALSSITFTSIVPPTISAGATGTFRNLKPNTVIRVPRSSLDAYQTYFADSLGSTITILGY